MMIELKEKARILEIERFAIHDGPGIRTTVFFQGCPLHCPWCANPESQFNSNQLMHNNKKCIKCGKCFTTCPEGVISFENKYPHFHNHSCGECRRCVDACPQNALKIAGTETTVDEIMKTIIRDVDYYRNTGGGITFSGGEALMQIDSLIPLLQKCKEVGINTAIETSGHIPTEYTLRALPLTDIFLFDIKQLDEALLKNTVGADMQLILHNLKIIVSDSPKKVILRIPCIPDFNLAWEFMEKLFSIAIENGILRIDMLPYHTLGNNKYKELGREYKCSDKALDKSELSSFIQRGSELGLDIRIDY